MLTLVVTEEFQAKDYKVISGKGCRSPFFARPALEVLMPTGSQAVERRNLLLRHESPLNQIIDCGQTFSRGVA